MLPRLLAVFREGKWSRQMEERGTKSGKGKRREIWRERKATPAMQKGSVL